jgi:hypothetical protein
LPRVALVRAMISEQQRNAWRTINRKDYAQFIVCAKSLGTLNVSHVITSIIASNQIVMRNEHREAMDCIDAAGRVQLCAPALETLRVPTVADAGGHPFRAELGANGSRLGHMHV